jgi:hypothetical protein
MFAGRRLRQEPAQHLWAVAAADVIRRPSKRVSLPKGANMIQGSVNKLSGAARPIKTKKDYSGAASVVEKISAQPDRESVAEERLQALLKEMDKFDAGDDDAQDGASADGYTGPLRRWSDGSIDTD